MRGVEIAADTAGGWTSTIFARNSSPNGSARWWSTAGTTALGAVDPIADVLDLRPNSVSAFTSTPPTAGSSLLLSSGSKPQARMGRRLSSQPSVQLRAAFRAIARCDSVVVDPHKHGLQPYGCGSVIFRDAAVGRFYKHDSPYTYFTSDDLHLGEISLECSRAGAAAAAFWATLAVLPTRAGQRPRAGAPQNTLAAVRWAELIEQSDRLRLVTEPSLDIVAFYPLPPDGDRRVSAISRCTQQVFETGMRDGSLLPRQAQS